MADKRRNRIRQLAAEKGLTIAQLAAAIDMRPHTLRRYSRHEAEPRWEICEDVARFFKVSAEYVMGIDEETDAIVSIPRSSSGDKIPVYGAAQGGSGFDVSHVNGPVDMIPRPHYLENAKDPYGVYVVGESMEPRFCEGEICIVHPGIPVRRGDWCVVQLRAGDETHAIVKRYRSMSSDHIVLEQLNPEQELRFDRAKLVALHKIVGVQIAS